MARFYRGGEMNTEEIFASVIQMKHRGNRDVAFRMWIVSRYKIRRYKYYEIKLRLLIKKQNKMGLEKHPNHDFELYVNALEDLIRIRELKSHWEVISDETLDTIRVCRGVVIPQMILNNVPFLDVIKFYKTKARVSDFIKLEGLEQDSIF